MDLKKKYWILSLGFVGLTLAFLVGIGAYLWQELAPEVRAQLSQSPDDLIVPLFLGGTILLIILLFFLNEMFQSYILPLNRLMEDSSLMTTVNLEHSVKVQGCREIMHLGERMNEAAAQLRQMRDRIEHGTVEQCEMLEQENAHILEALNRLPQGILLVNAWNQIVHFNSRALDICSRLMNGSEGSYRAIGYVGLGRSLPDLLGQQVATQAREATASLQADDSCGCPVVPIETDLLQEKGLRAAIVPLSGKQAGNEAYMVYLEQFPPPELKRSKNEACRCATPLICPLHDDFPQELLTPCRLDVELLWHPVPTPPLEDVPLSDLPCTIFDLETTGLDPGGGDEIVSISAVRVINSRIASEEPFHQLIRPRGNISLESERIHGISQNMVRNRPEAEKVLTSFCSYCRDSVLVSHCAEFDMLFLRRQGREAGLEFDNPVLDTLLLAAAVLSSRKDQSLEATARRLGTTVHGRHSSLGDALTAAEIYLKLVPLLAKQGVHTLRQAQEASRRMERFVDYSQIPKLCDLQGS